MNINKWIKIESERDFPQKDNSMYWIMKKGKVESFYWPAGETLNSVLWLTKITHYQPIEKPKPPIN